MSALTCRIYWLLFICTTWIFHTSAKEVRIVCYYTNWSVYRPSAAKFSPQNINPYLCTHLIYAFGGFTKENTLGPFDKYQDIEKGGYAKFVGLKTYNKNLKTLLAIGGWNEGSSRFSPMVANPDRRKELVKNAIKFLRQNHFDGLDLDWEYPSFRDGGKSRDRDNYAQLVEELREEFDRESKKTGRPRLLLTMAVPAGIEYINKGYDIPKLTKYLDWMNILSYDYHSAYEPAINHHSPLYSIEEDSEYALDIDLNIDYTIKHYLKLGADKTKLVLGIPTYGRSYTLYNPDANEIGDPADGPGEMGEVTRENGYLAYYEICENIKSSDWIVETPYPDAMGPYAYKDDQWVGYDDESIARKKAEYVAENGLGGIMFWSVDNDDFRGTCGEKPFPIIESAKEALLKAYGLTDASLLATTKKPLKTRGKSRTRATTKIETTTEALNRKTHARRPNSRRNRVNARKEEEETPTLRRRRPSSKRNRKLTTTTVRSTSTNSNLFITPSYTTPAPPSTPDAGGDFKCEEEGFFSHPRDCKKYFWCLSSRSELGIVAHQFNCPAGLYFNTAASSCDYSQNVLCNKKLSKPKTTTGTSTTSTTTSTRRTPPRITAATSRTTYITSTEPEYEDEYEEYEYEDEIKDDKKPDTVEDPKVIKELIELIKKAGGIEELEKQLIQEVDVNPSEASPGSTTPTINKSLYQRVLNRATATLTDKAKNAQNSLKYSSINRNSRGPQNEGIKENNNESAKIAKARPQYSSIFRKRPSTEPSIKEEEKEETINDADDDAEDDKDTNLTENFRRKPYKSQPEYVTIIRERTSTTTVSSSESTKKSRSHFLRLGEEVDEDVVENEDETKKRIREELISSTTSTPAPYVTIRRSRPTTTTPSPEDVDATETKPKHRPASENNIDDSIQNPEYVTMRRSQPVSETTTSKYVEIRSRGTTTSAPIEETQPPKPINSETTTQSDIRNETFNANVTPLTIDYSLELNTVGSYDLNEIAENLSPSVNVSLGNNTEKEVKSTTEKISDEPKPQLFEPRPFSFNLRTRPTTTTLSTTTVELSTKQPDEKQSQKPKIRPFLRRNITLSITTAKPVRRTTTATTPRTNVRRRYRPTTFTIVENQVSTSTKSINKSNYQHRFSTRRPITTKKTKLPLTTNLNVDQNLESSNQQSTEGGDTAELGDTAIALRTVQQGHFFTSNSFLTSTVPSTQLILKTTTSLPSSTRRHKPQTNANTFEKIQQHTTKTVQYDYDDSKFIGTLPEHSKVLIHSSGVIQCLDQGNFPHPVSCKKFISCAKMETGNVLGWEYTCPKGLSFDPIGGICNWSADLGCDQ